MLLDCLGYLALAIVLGLALCKSLKGGNSHIRAVLSAFLALTLSIQAAYALVYLNLLYSESNLTVLLYSTSLFAASFFFILAGLSSKLRLKLAILAVVCLALLLCSLFIAASPIAFPLTAIIMISLASCIMYYYFPSRFSRLAELGAGYALLNAAVFFYYAYSGVMLTILPNIMLCFIVWHLEGAGGLALIHRKRELLKGAAWQIASFFIVFLSTALLLTFAAMSIHEAGHSIAARYYSCTYTSVISQSQFLPHTSISCSQEHNLNVMLAAGFAATSLLALFFLLGRRQLFKLLSILIFSLGFLVSVRDFAELSMPQPLIFVCGFMMSVLLLYAVVRLTRLYNEARLG